MWQALPSVALLMILASPALGATNPPRPAEGEAGPGSAYPRTVELELALEALRLQAGEGGWATLGAGPALSLGDQGHRVAALRKRLRASGDLALEGAPGRDEEAEAPELFEGTLEAAVRAFQERHGLEADGIVGRRTQAALDVPIGVRIRQVERNLERQRRDSIDNAGPALFLNVPGFELEVVAGGERILTQRAIVGRCETPTPILTSEILYLTLNPYWAVPRSIARRTVVPNAARDPGYLQRLGFRVYRQPGGQEVDPRAVDWKSLVGSDPEFSFRQNPGPANALGRVRFSFPNRFGVALHGTPDLHLFEHPSRAYSSGCIRLEDPIALAALLLEADGGWSREALERAIEGGVTVDIPLPSPTPLHIVYWTAWIDPRGRLQLREDVYDRGG